MFALTDEKGNVIIITPCPKCGGEGSIVKCSAPGEHNEDDEGKYKDSYEKSEGHTHTIEVCELCKGLTLCIVNFKDLTYLRRPNVS